MAIRIATGCPLSSVTFDDADHPPITPSNTLLMLLPTRSARPTGICAVNAAANRCVALLALSVVSFFNWSSACGPPTLYHPTQLLLPAEILSVFRERV